MAAVNLARSAFTGLLRNSTLIKTPIVCRLSTVALLQKYQTIRNISKLNNNFHLLSNGVHIERIRGFATGPVHKITQSEISDRVMKVCRAYDKLSNVQSEKLGLRHFSHGPPLTIDLIKSRVLLVLQLYDKVDPEKNKFLMRSVATHQIP
ncbi:unnamed protein product [Leptidea sinapis]|uniref:Uncharacterized protein n=1 Tax=Leptidea sinapis TaxID=189913 RepID=A0A5E4Q2R9_9NEOP|nr:unnamed protein product [Leptidea sinapis]